MMRRILSALATLPVLLFAIGIALLCSCTSWMPDSSGFVFVKGDGSVVVYDLKMKAERLLVKVGPSKTMVRVGVDAKGKKFAVPIVTATKKKLTLSIAIVDLQGKALDHSETYSADFPKVRGGGFETVTCYWSSDGKRLLIASLAHAAVVTYEIETEKFKLYRNTFPIFGPAEGFTWMDINPVLPNSTGFIAASVNNKQLANPVAFRLYGWDGTSQPINNSDDEIEALSEQSHQKIALPPRWRGNVMEIPRDDGVLKIDVANRTMKVRKDAAIAELVKKVPDKKSRLIAHFGNDSLAFLRLRQTIEVYSPDKKEPSVTIAAIAPVVSVSPDNQLLLVLATQGKSMGYHVIDRDGQQIAFVKTKALSP